MSAGIADFADRRIEPIRTSGPEDDRHAFGRKMFCDRKTDARRGASDDGYAPGEIHRGMIQSTKRKKVDGRLFPFSFFVSMTDPAISLLGDLVAIDSVNPSLVRGAAGEAQIADAIDAHLRSLGLDVARQEAAAGRPNVIGVLEGRERGRTLMLCGHIDTVGVAGMKAPFSPLIRENRLYGRGAQDMNGGVAAMIDAARTARDRGFRKGRLVIAAVVDEE